VSAVADDPEEAGVLREVEDFWNGLPGDAQERIHLARLPMADVDENAAIVNALQRHSAVVVQKSIREGFGLTVAEAMWKTRPVAVSQLRAERHRAEQLGVAAKARVRREFLAPRMLTQQANLVSRLVRSANVA
jgi:trehalose synthase